MNRCLASFSESYGLLVRFERMFERKIHKCRLNWRRTLKLASGHVKRKKKKVLLYVTEEGLACVHCKRHFVISWLRFCSSWLSALCCFHGYGQRHKIRDPTCCNKVGPVRVSSQFLLFHNAVSLIHKADTGHEFVILFICVSGLELL